MTKAMERNIDACEIWSWRRMLRVAWTVKKTTESILQELGEIREGLSLLQRATRQKMMFFGHVMRADRRFGERDDADMRRGGGGGGGGVDDRRKGGWRRYWWERGWT